MSKKNKSKSKRTEPTKAKSVNNGAGPNKGKTANKGAGPNKGNSAERKVSPNADRPVNKGVGPARGGQQPGNAAEYLAIMPGVLMCAMLVIMLFLDISMPGMAQNQYEIFPGIFTVMDYLIIAGGLLHLGISAKRKELRFEKTDACFAGFALLILISTLVNGFNFMTIDGVPYRYVGILNMFAFLLIYMGVTGAAGRERSGDIILMGYLASADLIGLAALGDTLTGGIEAFHDKKEISAIFFNGNHYGYFLMMAVLIGLAYFLFDDGRPVNFKTGSRPATFKSGVSDSATSGSGSGPAAIGPDDGSVSAFKISVSRPAIFGAASAALNLIVLAINHSLGSILALIAVLICTGLLILIRDRAYVKRLGALTAAVLAVLVAALLISPALRAEFTGLAKDLGSILSNTADGSTGHRRLMMWRLTAGYISEKPLLGYGCEGIAFMLYDAMKVSDPHSEPLAYAAYYGIPAALLYIAGVTGVLIKSIRRSAAGGAQEKDACMTTGEAQQKAACVEGAGGVQQKAACMAAAGYFVSSFVGVGMFYTLPFFFIFLGLSQTRGERGGRARI